MVERAKRGHVSGVRLHFLGDNENDNDNENINYHELIRNVRLIHKNWKEIIF